MQTRFKNKPNLRKRIFATILDYGIYYLVFYLYVDFFGEPNNENGKTVTGFTALPIFLFWFIYFVLTESLIGATLCHHAFHLKVVTTERKLIGFGEAFKRHLLDIVDILMFFGLPAFITIKNTEKHQRIGDLWAKTIVVDTTDPEQYSD